LKILEDSPAKLEAMESTYAATFPFPSLSAASADFASSDITSNAKVMNAVTTTLDAIASVDQDIRTLESFLRLHLPKMEDGNNFGVTVQLSLLKDITDLQGVTAAKIDELSGYAGARADALEKLKLPSTGSSVTKSTSVTTTDGKKEEKSSESTEEKKTTSDESGPIVTSRKAALVAIDTQYYSKAQRAFQSVLTSFMASLDFLDKNKEKLEKPKGSGGAHSGFSSMY
jgi:Proteasome activator pa28 beta subunit